MDGGMVFLAIVMLVASLGSIAHSMGEKDERSKWCDKHKDRTVYEKCMDEPEYGK